MSIPMTMVLFVTTLTIVTALPMIENSTEVNYKDYTETIAPSSTPQKSVNSTTFSFASGNYSDEAVPSSSNKTPAPWMSVNSTTLSSTSGNYSDYPETIATSSTPQESVNSTTFSFASGNYSDEAVPSSSNTTSTTIDSTVDSTTFSFASGNYSDEAVPSSSNKTPAPWMSVNSTTLSSTSGNYSVKNVTGTTEKSFNSPTLASATANYSSVLLNSTTRQPETTTSQPETTTSGHYYEVTNYKTDDDEYNAKKSFKQYEPEFELKHHWNFPSLEETTTPCLKDNQTEMRSNKTGNKNKKRLQYPNKCQVLFDLWLRDSENNFSMSKVDWNVLPLTKISNTVHNISEIMEKKKTILNTFDVLSKIIKKFVKVDTKGSGSLLRLFNESTTMKDLFKIVDASNIVQLPYNETTNEIGEKNINNSSFDQMEKMAHTLMDSNVSNKSRSHGQKKIRKTSLTFTYSEEEPIIDDSSSDE